MAKVSINERLAQLISEKNMGLKSSSANDISNSSASHTEASNVVVVKQLKTDSVEINSKDGESVSSSSQTSVKSSQQRAVSQQKVVVAEGNPFLHNQVVDDIAKKMLKAFVGN